MDQDLPFSINDANAVKTVAIVGPLPIRAVGWDDKAVEKSFAASLVSEGKD